MKKSAVKMRKFTLCAIGMLSVIQFGFGLFLIMGTPVTDTKSQTTTSAQNEDKTSPRLPKFAALDPKDS